MDGDGGGGGGTPNSKARAVTWGEPIARAEVAAAADVVAIRFPLMILVRLILVLVLAVVVVVVVVVVPWLTDDMQRRATAAMGMGIRGITANELTQSVFLLCAAAAVCCHSCAGDFGMTTERRLTQRQYM